MTESTTLSEEEIPKWDLALAGLAKETYRVKGAGLDVDDFHKLAVEHAIRFDDIMVTMFELCIYDEWHYVEGRESIDITQETLDQLYVNGRLREKDMRGYTGCWSPAV